MDWHEVRKITLWNYDALLDKLKLVMSYPFVLEHYNHTMPQAQAYAASIQQGYYQNRKEDTFSQTAIARFQALERLGIRDYDDLVQRVDTMEKCEYFISESGYDFIELIHVLDTLFRLVLPFAIPIRELFDLNDPVHASNLEHLKRMEFKSNLDILEKGRTSAGRLSFARQSSLPEAFILQLVHRADISRLAYARGKTIQHLCGGGYDTLEKIAGADRLAMEKDMDVWYRSIGKTLADYKAVIPLDWMIGGARILPKVVEG